MMRAGVVTDSQVKCLWIALFALVVADGVITNFLIRFNLATEANPLLRGIAGHGVLPIIKIFGAGVIVFVLRRVYRRNRPAAARASVLSVMAYTGIVYWNIMTYFVSQV